MSTVQFHWEQDGAGGDHGAATYFPGTPRETRVVLPCFSDALALDQAIGRTIQLERSNARAELLAEIARIRP